MYSKFIAGEFVVFCLFYSIFCTVLIAPGKRDNRINLAGEALSEGEM